MAPDQRILVEADVDTIALGARDRNTQLITNNSTGAAGQHRLDTQAVVAGTDEHAWRKFPTVVDANLNRRHFATVVDEIDARSRRAESLDQQRSCFGYHDSGEARRQHILSGQRKPCHWAA